jgi:hypothetical protein
VFPSSRQKQQDKDDKDDMYEDIQLNLRFLPKSGCFALYTTLTQLHNNNDDAADEDSFSYYAIVDTASPFLTAPTNAATNAVTRPANSALYPPSNEQYGNSLGGMEWRQTDVLTWIVTSTTTASTGTQTCVLESSSVVLGITSPQVIQETGGIFLGLIDRDDYRPTLWQQLRPSSSTTTTTTSESNSKATSKATTIPSSSSFYRSFQLHFNPTHPQLRWTRRSLIPSSSSATTTTQCTSDYCGGGSSFVFPLLDLTPYGPDLYHYAVLVERLEFRVHDDDTHETSKTWTTLSTTTSNQNTNNELQQQQLKLSRPVVAVLDTGLTGCILSSSLADELADWRIKQRKKKNDETTTDTKSSTATDNKVTANFVSMIQGVTVSLSTLDGKSSPSSPSSSPTTLSLTSDDRYWRLSRLELPWWYDKNNSGNTLEHPHIIALGSTFWANGNVQSLTIDTLTRRARIDVA